MENSCFDILTENKTHYCEFCNAAKTTTDGLKLCLKNKNLAIRKALKGKDVNGGLYIGQCYLGITEIVKPVFMDDRPFCIIYLGNFLVKEKKDYIKNLIKDKCSLTGVKDNYLLEKLSTLEIINEADLKNYIEIIELISSSIEMCLSEHLKNRKSDNSITSTKNKHWIIQLAEDYIKQYYKSDIKLSQIAKLYFVNPQYLCRLFVKELGINFSDYLNNIRIQEAKSLLLKSALSITDIALAVGFNNITYFNAIFKKHTSMTPRQYRKAN
jgi:AraC-like DNA-binding protein/ligand-binding sensor protein